MNKNWVYLSYPLNQNTPAYGGGKGFFVKQDKNMDAGDSCNTSLWSLPNHTGTHIDFPRHFAARGNALDAYEAGFFVFEHVHAADISMIAAGMIIGPDELDIANAPKDVELLLIKTGFGQYRDKPIYWQENPGFHPDLGDYLRQRFPALRALGFDSISLSSFVNRDLGRKAHKAFLDHEKPILPLEDLDLRLVNYQSIIKKAIVAPMHVFDADGAPCTVLAEI